jgi:hypothetical protein
MSYVNAAQILDAIIHCSEEGSDPSGAYRLIPSWVGSARVWIAEPIKEDSGFEVAYDALLLNRSDLYDAQSFDRIGVGFDEEANEFCLTGLRVVRTFASKMEGEYEIYVAM